MGMCEAESCATRASTVLLELANLCKKFPQRVLKQEYLRSLDRAFICQKADFTVDPRN